MKIVDLPDPVPAAEEYLIAIHASATNFFDLLQIAGKYQHQPPFPWVAGAEFAGVVLQAPKTVRGGKPPKFQTGDKVFGSAQGGYATKITSTEERLRPIPKGWSFFDAAGLFVTAPTSYGALVQRANVKKGWFFFFFFHFVARHGLTFRVKATGFSFMQQRVEWAWRPYRSRRRLERQ